MSDDSFSTEIASDVVEVMQLFRGLASQDVYRRAEACATIKEQLLLWANSGLLPARQCLGSAARSLSDDHAQLNVDSGAVALDVYLLTLLRYSVQCPFDDVRTQCSSLFSQLQEKLQLTLPAWLLAGPSMFMPSNETVPVTTFSAETKMLFTETFLQNNRLDHLTHVMGFHPEYLAALLRAQNMLLRGDGPLPQHYRHYLAIIAAARHQCAYLIHIHKAEFLLCGGNKSWLESPTSVPEKLQSIHEVNRVLAHRPWLINKGHIAKLTRGNGNWSMSELMHALVILTHFHALSTAVFGCGINGEIDAAAECQHCVKEGAAAAAAATGQPASPADATVEQPLRLVPTRQWPALQPGHESPNDMFFDDSVDNLLQKLKRLQEECPNDCTEEEVYQRFKHIESQSAELRPGEGLRAARCTKCVTPFVIEPEFCYADFARCRSESDVQTLRASDYSWENHGYLVANRFYADVGTVLDDKFTIAKELTYHTMGNNCDVNTEAFRRGIWNYIHCIFGIMHDDYNYAEVNTLLQKNLKSYIKTITCYPERLTRKDFDLAMKGFKYSEKVHVNIIVLEARMQAELLYALRAVTHYMT